MTEPFKRFMVFEIIDYGSAGGLDDIVSSHDTIEEAQKAVKKIDTSRGHGQIFDRIEGIEVES